jgi:hydrogenase small subunit
MEETNQKKTKSYVNRRDFLKMCGFMAATLALPPKYAMDIAKALTSATRPPVLWLEFSSCTGDTESLIHAAPGVDPLQSTVTDPDIVDLLLKVVSVDYQETIMAPSGNQAKQSLLDTVNKYAGKYICIIEGAIPSASNGIYCTIGGETALSIAQQVLPNAFATIGVGTCAFDGGLSAAAPNLTGAIGVKDAFPGLKNLVNLPGCPMNVTNLIATVVYVVTFNKAPDLDSSGRPLFAYGDIIHNSCERRPHFDKGEYVLAWGDSGHQNGWCLYQMGCKGPATHHNCSIVRWNSGTSWPVAGGHGCIGCAEPRFWDNLTPVYKSLSG